MEDRLKKNLALLTDSPEEFIELFGGLIRLVDKASGRVILCSWETDAMIEAVLHKNCIEHAQKMRLTDLLGDDYGVIALPEPAPKYVSFVLSRKEKDTMLPFGHLRKEKDIVFDNFCELIAMFEYKAELKNNSQGASARKHLPLLLEIDGQPTPLAIWLHED